MGTALDRKRKALRKRAEELLKKRNPKGSNTVTREDLDYLLHELSVHQVELEIQNEDLLKTQQSLLDSQRKYSYLYNFAPVGYFTLDLKGIIQEANVTGCNMLEVQRLFLQGQYFILSVDKQDKMKFLDHWQEILDSSKGEKNCELRLLKGRKTPFWAELTCKKFVDDNGQTAILMIVADISEHKARQ